MKAHLGAMTAMALLALPLAAAAQTRDSQADGYRAADGDHHGYYDARRHPAGDRAQTRVVVTDHARMVRRDDRYRYGGDRFYFGGGYYPYGYGYGYDVGVAPYPAYAYPYDGYGAYEGGYDYGPPQPEYAAPEYYPPQAEEGPPPSYQPPPEPPRNYGSDRRRWTDWSAGAPPADCGRWVWHEEVRRYHWEPAACAPPCPPDWNSDRDENR
jgi:hypothetical protein